MSDVDRISEIEHLIATGKMTAAQVFTQMKQLLKTSGTPKSWEPVAWCFTDVNGKPKELTDSPETKSEQDMRIYMPLFAHPPAKVPEGWSLKKVEDDMTTITITRDSDGSWCGGGIKEDSGANGLRYEFLDALLTTPATATAAGAEWVKCSDRLPTEYDADIDGNVWYSSAGGAHRENYARVQMLSKKRRESVLWHPTGLKRPTPPQEQ